MKGKRIKLWVARILVFSMMITSMSILYVKEINAADYTNNGCVRWVKERTKSKLGITLPGTGLNKYNLNGANNYWYTLNYNKGSEPKENSLAVWEFNNGSDGYKGKCGHVAFVESVNGNNVTVTEGGCKGYSYGGNTGVICRTIDKSQMATLGKCSGFLGYIYLVDSTPNPNPDKINRYNVNEIATNSGLSITPGDYRIVSALDSTYGIDIQGGSSESGANVQLYQNLSSWDQIYSVTSLGKGYYKIMNKEIGTVLDVKDGSIENGANVQAYAYNDTDAQKWVIKDAGDGYNYEIVSKASGLCLDVNGGIAANNTNIQIHSVNNTAAQKWRFIPVDELSTRTIKDGEYHIVSKLDESKGLDVSGASKEDMANVGIYPNINDPNQTFIIKYLDDGYYSIMFNYSGTYLDRYGNYQINGANIDVTTWNGTDAQKWIIKPDGSSGYYWIIGKGCAKCLDITSGITDDLTNVQSFSINGSDAQKWKFISVDTTGITPTSPASTSTPRPTPTSPTATPTPRPRQTLTVTPTIKPINANTSTEGGSSDKPVVKSILKLSKVRIVSVKNNKKKTVKIKIKAVKNAKYYKIQYSTNKNFKKKLKIKTKTTKRLSFTLKNLKKKKIYYFRICAINGKMSGSWSKVKKVKIKR